MLQFKKKTLFFPFFSTNRIKTSSKQRYSAVGKSRSRNLMTVFPQKDFEPMQLVPEPGVCTGIYNQCPHKDVLLVIISLWLCISNHSHRVSWSLTSTSEFGWLIIACRRERQAERSLQLCESVFLLAKSLLSLWTNLWLELIKSN